MKNTTNCENCKHYDSAGYCHRYPPVRAHSNMVGMRPSVYPPVSKEDYCGEFEPAGKK